MPKTTKVNEKGLEYEAIKGTGRTPDSEHYDKGSIERPTIAVALSPEETNDIIKKIEAKIAEYEQAMNS